MQVAEVDKAVINTIKYRVAHLFETDFSLSWANKLEEFGSWGVERQ